MSKYIILLISTFISINSFSLVKDSKEIVEVAQREYIFTDSVEHDYIQTYGVYTCVAVIISGINGRASLAHFDGGTNVEQALSWMLRDYSNLSELSISLYGGQPPFKLENDIVNSLQGLGFTPKTIVRNNSKNHSKSIMVNVLTGEIFNYRETVSSTDWKIASAKVNRLKFGRSIYRHEKSIGGGDVVEVIESSLNSMFGF
jgi:hypothetical protein